MKSYYTVVLQPYDEGFLVTAPDVPGCVTSGKTIPEAVTFAEDALCGCICAYEDENVDLPPQRTPDQLTLESGTFAVMVEVDTLKYRQETDNRAVRKNVSMPAWMLNMADSKGINCSQVLQDALKVKLGIT